MPSETKYAAVIKSIPDRPDEVDPGFVPFPNHLIERLWKFEGRSLQVYLAILSHDKRGTRKVWPSKRRIQEMTRLSESTIRRAIRTLEKLQLIQTRIRANQSSEYCIRNVLTTR